MVLRLFTTSVMAATLLLNTFRCSKQEQILPEPNKGSFQLDGTTIDCRAKATPSAGSIGTTSYDLLSLDLTPTSATGTVERLELLLYKVPGSPATSYSLHHLLVYTRDPTSPYYFAHKSFSVRTDNDGTFSGSFSGEVKAASSAVPGPYTTIANGVFTRVEI